MQICKNPKDLRALSAPSIGFVPTMGALHAGHLSLIERAKAENAFVVVSIFVNPTQFGANEDFGQYPRPLEKDLELCAKAGVHAVFTPKVETLYPFKDAISLTPPKDLLGFEADLRPGHFSGVLQVVLKLFNLVRPTKAYFGQKDAQQLLILQRMVQDLFLPVEVIACPTLRDSDGLALSSRNAYLSQEQRQLALKIPKALSTMKEAYEAGITQKTSLLTLGQEVLSPLEVQYLSLVDRQLLPLERVEPGNSLILTAVKVGNTRLLDNLWL
ncbi:pantoate--beta-alanine ligase [Helicobacter heilmannii]|uniref:pantoate--beta-alanine ligase n=1 Tax=Helicobacter heilmannii TaxID=35817 RepID=UPI0006A0EB8A|nr:pantoate--beta-alanine ligase [Helicobacter heilmannii]GMB94938.1 Pantoate-beta-alanine ligase PanC [Helicobacter heilmannii]CRF46827.1 Pantoate--beta-alanine ligase [Helicobacter heilmannii]